MKRYFICTLLVGLWGNLFSQITLLPQPEQMEILAGRFQFNSQTRFYCETTEQEAALSLFLDRAEIAMGFRMAITAKPLKKNGVILKHLSTLPEEGYNLQITPQTIVIEASTAAGYFYATQSLLQLLPVDVFGGVTTANIDWSIPALSISDSPQYAYRGFMLDVSRYFLPKAEVLKLLDYLAIHKINKFHFHLVDDNGWRIEIKKYPLLGTVGGYRVKREGLFQNRQNPLLGEPTPVGGFYTQAEIKEIVQYAQERSIEVIPEIEMPAHSNAALAAYPHLTCPVVDEFIGTLPGIGGKKASIIYCAGNDEVFDFLEDVIDEVAELFPSNYLHIGGDEAWKEHWEECPLCQKRMKEEHIPNEEELQSYFIRRMNNYLKSKGKKLMGWDELTESEIPQGATIFGWRGMGQSAALAAQKGHDVILTPARALYLIRYQGPQWFEPFTYFGNNTLKDVYQYEPSLSGITPELQPRVKGIQASMWTEFINSKEELHYMVFPRLAALADIAWSKQPKDWSHFLTRMDRMCQIYDQLNLTHATSMFNLAHQVRAEGQEMRVSLSCIRPDVEIRYTLDGTLPTATSPLYVDELLLPSPSKVIAQTFQADKAKGKALILTPAHALSTGARITGNATGLECLVNGIYGSECYTDGEYLDLYNRDLEMTLDLGTPQEITKIAIGSLLHAGMGVTQPASICLEYSTDGLHFSTLEEKVFDANIRFPNSFTKQQIVFEDFPSTQAQFIRLTAKRPGIIPPGEPREGQPGRITWDEIAIY
ncbi:MAG: glycoside hydrolase family 20 protein [Phocaeicola sp.]